MNYDEFSTKIKTKYPQYKDMDNKTLAQKMVAKFPQYSDVTFDEQSPDWKGVVGKAVNAGMMRPETVKAASDPVFQAKALPGLAGLAGGMSPIPGGATLGTVGGRQLSNLALRAYGRPEEIPSGTQQVVEGGLAALGDVAAIPAIKKSYYGSKIGQAETLAGAKNIEKAAPPSSARTAVKFIQGLKNRMNTEELSPLEARSIKPALDMIHRKGWLAGTEYGADLAQMSQRLNAVVNKIPGRAAPAAAMSQAMTIPRTIGKAYNMVPPNIRKVIGYGVGVGIGGGTGYELIRKLLGG